MHDKHQKVQKFKRLGETETEEMTKARKAPKSTKLAGGEEQERERQAQGTTEAVLRLNAPRVAPPPHHMTYTHKEANRYQSKNK